MQFDIVIHCADVQEYFDILAQLQRIPMLIPSPGEPGVKLNPNLPPEGEAPAAERTGPIDGPDSGITHVPFNSCVWCGRRYELKNKRERYCSPECRICHLRADFREADPDPAAAAEPGRTGPIDGPDSGVPPVPSPGKQGTMLDLCCPQCHEWFTPRRHTQKFCTVEHRNAWHNARAAELRDKGDHAGAGETLDEKLARIRRECPAPQRERPNLTRELNA